MLLDGLGVRFGPGADGHVMPIKGGRRHCDGLDQGWRQLQNPDRHHRWKITWVTWFQVAGTVQASPLCRWTSRSRYYQRDHGSTLEQARKARLFILDKMLASFRCAPGGSRMRITMMKVRWRRSTIIGPGGKNIRAIQKRPTPASTSPMTARFIAATEGNRKRAARRSSAGRSTQIGRIYTGNWYAHFGAFVEIHRTWTAWFTSPNSIPKTSTAWKTWFK